MGDIFIYVVVCYYHIHPTIYNVYVPITQLSRPFMLAVQSSRRAGQLERALDWVILWLKALGENITAHMAEPVTLWVKTKTDALRTGEEDVRLRYTNMNS